MRPRLTNSSRNSTGRAGRLVELGVASVRIDRGGLLRSMLCERCHEEQATVHVTCVLDRTTEAVRHDLCERCYQESDFHDKGTSVGWTSYNPPVPKKPYKQKS